MEDLGDKDKKNGAGSSVHPADMTYLAQLLRRRAGLEMTTDHSMFVESRLLDLLYREKIGNVGELVRRLRAGPEGVLHRDVVEHLALHETSFFRDFHPFVLLENVLLPWLLERRQEEKRLRLWSAATSTGQEAYSLAITAARVLAGKPGWSAEVLGTDFSSDNIARARRGTYGKAEVNRGLPAADLLRYFEQRGDLWSPRAPLQRMVAFRELNLVEPWTETTAMDVILARNAIMYFAPEARRPVFRRLLETLKPDGFLFLGSGELERPEGFDAWRWNSVTFFRPSGAEEVPGLERVERARPKKEKNVR